MITCKVYYLGGIEQDGVNCLVIEFEKNIILFNFGEGSVPDDFLGVSRQVPNSSYLANKLKSGFQIIGLFLNSFSSKYMGGIPYLLNEIPDLQIYCSSITARILRHFIAKKIHRTSIKIVEVYSGKTITPSLNNSNTNYVKIKPFSTLSKSIGSVGYYLEIKDQAFCIVGEFLFGPKISKNAFNDIVAITQAANNHPTLLLTCDAKNINHYGYTYPKNSVIKALSENFEKGTIVIIIDIEESTMLLEILALASSLKKNVLLVGETLKYHFQVYKDAGDIKNPHVKFISFDKLNDNEYKNTIVIFSDSYEKLMNNVNKEFVSQQKNSWKQNIAMICIAIQYLPRREIHIQKFVSDLSKISKTFLLTKDNYLSSNASFLDIVMLQDILRFKGGYFIIENLNESVLAKMQSKLSSIIPPLFVENFEVLEFRRNRLIEKRGKIFGMKTQKFTSIENHQISSNVLSIRKVLSSNGIVMIMVLLSKNNKYKKSFIEIKTKGVFFSKQMAGKIEMEMKKEVIGILHSYEKITKEALVEEIKKKIKQIIKNTTKKQSIIDVYFLEV